MERQLADKLRASRTLTERQVWEREQARIEKRGVMYAENRRTEHGASRH